MMASVMLCSPQLHKNINHRLRANICSHGPHEQTFVWFHCITHNTVQPGADLHNQYISTKTIQTPSLQISLSPATELWDIISSNQSCYREEQSEVNRTNTTNKRSLFEVQQVFTHTTKAKLQTFNQAVVFKTTWDPKQNNTRPSAFTRFALNLRNTLLKKPSP